MIRVTFRMSGMQYGYQTFQVQSVTISAGEKPGEQRIEISNGDIFFGHDSTVEVLDATHRPAIVRREWEARQSHVGHESIEIPQEMDAWE